MLSNIYKGTLNPLNIRHNPDNVWLGSMVQNPYKGFVRFIDQVFGVRAAIVLLKNYYSKGFRSVSSIVTRWAPPSENDTRKYIEFVEDSMIAAHCHPDHISMKDLSFYHLVRSMAKYESGYDLSLLEYNYVVNRFDLFNEKSF